jgi:uncharacterized protein (DUF488 family)
MKARIFTVGHSNRKFSEFLKLLDSQKLKLVIDVRTIPKSRHNPQFGQGRLERGLRKHGIEYRHMANLGGLRRANKDSDVNAAWRNMSFRGYADYMQTPEFEKALERLIALARRKRLVIMCAEAVPWRCHRSLIADALLARKIPSKDIMSATNARPHKMTSFAKVRNGHVTYPPSTQRRTAKTQ